MTKRWTVVVPVKETSVGKSRLAAYGQGRAELARSMALDTIDAVRRAACVSRVVLVTADEEVADAAGSWDGVDVIPDPAGGLIAAIDAGIATIDPDVPAAIVTADLPGLRPGDLDAVLEQAGHHPLSVVADADAVGTTLLAADHARDLSPRFGEDSLAAHLELGAHLLDAPQGLRRDADIPAHLDGLGRLLGHRTAMTMSRLALR